MRLNLCADERPHTFDGMVGQEKIVENIRRQSKKDLFFPCYILEGQFGSGKTTMAGTIARAVNCTNKDHAGNPCGTCPACKAIAAGVTDVIEMDAASNTGVDAIRELKESVGFLPGQLKKKVYIIDEVHKLSDSAFNALLKVLEEPPEHVIFILCTTEAKKIPATIRSRAALYHFARIPSGRIEVYLKEMCKKYGIAFTDEGVSLIAKNAQGAMRNALKLLEQAALADDGVTEGNVKDMLGLTDPQDLFLLLEALVTGNVPEAVRIVREQLLAGRNPQLLISDCMDIVADSVPASVAGVYPDTGTAHYNRLLKRLVEVGSGQIFCALAEGFMDVTASLGRNADDSTLLCGIISLATAKRAAVSVLEKRMADLEEMVKRGIFTGQEEPLAPFVEDAKAQDEEILPDAPGTPEETFLQNEDCVGDERPVPVLERADDDIWEMLLAQSFREASGTEAQKSPEACGFSRMLPANRPMPGGGMAEALQTLYEDPLLESVLALGFRQEDTPDGPVMETDMEPVYRVAAAYHAAKGFPFAIRMKQPA